MQSLLEQMQSRFTQMSDQVRESYRPCFVRRRRWTDQLRYSLDERSLAAFRIFIAAIYLHDAWEHWDDLELFYTDGGLAPREAGVSSYTWTGILNWPWSLSHWSVLQLGWPTSACPRGTRGRQYASQWSACGARLCASLIVAPPSHGARGWHLWRLLPLTRRSWLAPARG